MQIKIVGLLLIISTFAHVIIFNWSILWWYIILDSAFTKRTYVEGFLSNAFEVMYVDVWYCSGGRDASYNRRIRLYASDELLKMDDYTKRYQNGEYR